jgi:hypothetical protein
VKLGRLLPALLAMAACHTGTTSLYIWDGYEDAVFASCAEPDGFDAQGTIAELEALVERANAEQRGVPPGVHAFLGYLYYREGDVDGALAAFESEKELYPESTVFVDGMLARMGARTEG